MKGVYLAKRRQDGAHSGSLPLSKIGKRRNDRKFKQRKEEQELSIHTVISERNALVQLLNEVRQRRLRAESDLSVLRNTRGTTDWSRHDSLVRCIADRTQQEQTLNTRIATLEQQINQAKALNFPTNGNVDHVPPGTPPAPAVTPLVPPAQQVPPTPPNRYYYPYGYPVQVVQNPPPSEWGMAALVFAALAGIALIIFAWRSHFSGTPVVVNPPQAAAQQACETTSGGTFRIGSHVYTATRVGPCANGAVVPQSAAVYTDGELRMFGVPIAKGNSNSNPNDRFVGYTTDAVTLQGTDGFWFIQDVNSQQIARDWKDLLEAMGHHVAGPVELKQR